MIRACNSLNFSACKHSWRALLAVGAMAVAAGCGSVSSSSAISDASRDLREAKAQKADQFAVYYYTRAETYLEKSKECNGMGQYQVAATYARTSQEASEKALDVAKVGKDQAARREKFAPKKSDKDKKGGPGFTPSGED